MSDQVRGAVGRPGAGGEPRSALDRRLLLASATLVGAAALSRVASAGPLTPPDGPVGPTGRTLDEIYGRVGDVGALAEPRVPLSQATTPGDSTAVFRVTQPGSYVLTKNLTGVADRAAIRVDADDVTIDLNGFSIVGTLPSAGVAIRTFLIDGVAGVVVRTGTIRTWGSYVLLNTRSRCVFEDLRVVGPSLGSFDGPSNRSAFRRVQIDSSGEVGIIAGEGTLVEDCTITRFPGATSGPFTGIQSSVGSVIQRCVVTDCGRGIQSVGGIVRDCTVLRCTDVSTADGAGIIAQSALVEGCTVQQCAGVGIRVMGDSVVLNNRVGGCGTGIGDSASIGGGRNRIEGNSVSLSSGFGIRLQKPRNVVARNSVAQSTMTDYDLASGNVTGEIIDGSAGAVLGAGASAWANVRF